MSCAFDDQPNIMCLSKPKASGNVFSIRDVDRIINIISQGTRFRPRGVRITAAILVVGIHKGGGRNETFWLHQTVYLRPQMAITYWVCGYIHCD